MGRKLLRLNIVGLTLLAVLLIVGCNKKNETSQSNDKKTSKSQVKDYTKPNPESEFKVKLTDDGQGCIVTEYIGENPIVVIPATIQGLPVKKVVGKFCHFETIEYKPKWEEYEDLKNLLIALKSGRGQFTVKYISYPDTAEEIGDLDNYRVLERVKLPKTMKKCPDFRNCPSLSSVVLCEGITELYETFLGCSALKSVIVPEGVVGLYGTFKGCKSLEEVKLPSTLKYMQESAGWEWDGSGKKKSISQLDELSGVFQGCKSLKIITIPNGVTVLGTYCFAECASLEEIVLPESIEELDWMCFENCSSLTSIVLPKSIQKIYDGCFNGCSKLTRVEINEETQKIQFISYKTANGWSRNTPYRFPSKISWWSAPWNNWGNDLESDFFAKCNIELQNQAKLKQIGYTGTF